MKREANQRDVTCALRFMACLAELEATPSGDASKPTLRDVYAEATLVEAVKYGLAKNP